MLLEQLLVTSFRNGGKKDCSEFRNGEMNV